ncbi:MAG: type II toxin-antitoxin system YafQ family toxin [Patescibacteria group bacterium]
MEFLHSRKFDKNFKRLPNTLRQHFFERQDIFAEDRRHPLLRDHALQGKLIGYRSFSVTGDISVLYEEINASTVRLINIGTHHELYGS